MSKSIISPRCGYHLKVNAENCRNCGFSFKAVFGKAVERDILLESVVNEYEKALLNYRVHR